ncbi:cellulose binding domain-containing protein [Marinobacter segnicrescens]|uniref:cellulose binding domain-containing protein n=1 Tax=Marinobacter segnicrescens TaxID=430453 RepID=UPI003A9214C5
MKTRSRLALLLCGSALTGTALADSLCEVDYRIQHSWQTGAVHRVQLTYNGPEVREWNLGWRFAGQEQIDSIFNVTHTQDGQDVAVSNLPWNAGLAEGSEIRFGFNVRNPSGEVPETFYLNGQPCNTDQGEPAPNPDSPEEPPVDGGEPNNPEAPVVWSLDEDASHLGFVTTKNQHTVESHNFGALSGTVSEDGIATLNINLDTVDTGIDIRNQRMREMLFNTSTNPEATVAIELGDNLGRVLGLSAGEVLALEIPAAVQINGESRELNTSLRVQHLGSQRFLVSSSQPLIITADQFELDDGVEALREVAGLSAISLAVPVDFALIFEADELPTP